MVLLASQRAGGWGYNGNTACDADSTSWVVRFLARVGVLGGISASAVLSPYVMSSGRVRTFASVERFGRWATAHDEVAPVAGLALLAAGDQHRALGIRASVIDSWKECGWQRFWWQTRAYVCAQSLEFLALSGGIPEAIAQGELMRLAEPATSGSALAIAQKLAASVYLEDIVIAERWCLALLDLQCVDGSWPSSLELCVPHQHDPSQVDVQCDDRRLLTTAASLVALARWSEYLLAGSPRKHWTVAEVMRRAPW